VIDQSLRNLYQEVKQVRGLAGAFYPLAMGEMIAVFPRPEDHKGIAGGKPIPHAHERCDTRLTRMRSGHRPERQL